MKASIIKKTLLAALTVSLVMAPVMGVCASDLPTKPGSDPPSTSGNSSSSSSSSSSSDEVVSYVEALVSEETGGAVTSLEEVPTSSSVAGVQTTTAGVYLAQSVSGIAVNTASATIAQGYALAAGERPYIRVYDMDPQKSYLAKQCMDAAAASQGAILGPMLNLEFGKMSGGKYSLLSTEGPEIRMSVALPKSFAQSGRTYAVIRVRAGGAVSILQDVDTNPDTVTFNTTGGAGAYALIKY